MSKRARSGTLILLTALTAFAASLARADAPDAAKALYRRGTADYALGKYADAAKEYEAAFELRPDPALLYDAAQAYRLAGVSARAVELYESYLRIFGDQVANRTEVERHIKDLKQALDAQQRAASSPPLTPEKGALALSDSFPRAAAPKPSEAGAPAPSKPETAAPPAHLIETPADRVVTVNAKATDKKPLFKKAWFWSVVAGGAALVAGGIAVGVVLGQSKTGTLPLARF
jgi:tetratricopeptide (TPR) repeat protein